jgi:hypothetical protein
VARYRFVTDLRFTAPIDEVYRSVVEPERWLDGWSHAVSVERRSAGAETGVGASFVATVRAPLGYRLSARIEVVAAEPLTGLWMTSSGDLDGYARWRLAPHPGGTDVRFTWDVRTTERWMQVLTPVARPIFEWSHGVVVRRAAEAAARDLACDLPVFRSRAVRSDRPRPRP